MNVQGENVYGTRLQGMKEDVVEHPDGLQYAGKIDVTGS